MKRPEVLDAIKAVNTHKSVVLPRKLGRLDMLHKTDDLVPYGDIYSIRALLGSEVVINPHEKHVPDALARTLDMVRRNLAHFLYKEVIDELRGIQSDLYDDHSETALRTLSRIDKMIRELSL